MYIYIGCANLHDIHVSDTFVHRSGYLVLRVEDNVVSRWTSHNWQILWESKVKTEDQIVRLKELIDVFCALGTLLAENAECASKHQKQIHGPNAFAEIRETASVI
jgi:hypothetical protein